MPHHVVVDGSNLATEGRTVPSLKQLNEAVLAYIDEEPDALITVVVDATFGHRIDAKEVPEFDAAVANNELVAPPAGAVGRGDAFVLSIANKVGATILTNDSFQEFHGQYTWLFDDGRIVGGKPVPHIGWVFVPRTPVRGPTSRKSVQESKRRSGRGATVRQGSVEASLPLPIPKAPPPGPVTTGRRSSRATKAIADVEQGDAPTSKSSTTNDLLTFLTFVELHPPGTSVSAIVESYSSHGAYVGLGDVKGYVPLRLMGDPPPRSARDLGKVGEAVTLVVESFAPARRSIDLAIPSMATARPLAPTPRKRASKKAAAVEPVVEVAGEAPTDGETSLPAPKATRKRAAKKVAPIVDSAVAPVAAATSPPAAPSRRKRSSAAPAAAPAPPVKRVSKRGATKAATVDPIAEPVPDAAPAPAPTKRRTRRT